MSNQLNFVTRIAVVGSGPAAMYAIEHLLEQRQLEVEIDIFERLPSPWGLVRYGVAPDHPEKKLVVDRLFEFVFRRPEVRFFGNIEIGEHITIAELSEWYDAVVVATGANSDTQMGVPGEGDLRGCWAARELVAWYNGHPDFSDLSFDLSCERAVVVGNGNVALDVARILTLPIEVLEKTDIADYALDALRTSNIKEVVLLGRRGHLQGAFNNPELEELLHLPGVDTLVEGADFSAPMQKVGWETRRKVATLASLASRPSQPGNKRIVFKFLSSPVALLGTRGQVEKIEVAANALETDESGTVKARRTGEVSELDTGLVLRAIGYRGAPFPGLPFDERRAVIDHAAGRIVDNAGVYVTGWIKRGAQGVIGTNKKCAGETVGALLEDVQASRLTSAGLDASQVAEVISSRKLKWVDKQTWGRIDHHERLVGRQQQRPRVKLTSIKSMLEQA